MPAKKKAVRKPATVKKKPRIVKKTIKRAAPKRILRSKTPRNLILGKISHYFPLVNAAVVQLKGPLKIGDTIKIEGHTTDFSQIVSSMQINCVPIQNAQKGQEIGILVTSRVRRRDTIYKA